MRSFQDDIPRNHCFGCGPLNPDGLQIESRWAAPEDPSEEARVAVCRWRARPHHMAGPTHVVNGGMLATVIDCHAICTAIADAYEREGRELGSGPEIWYATGELTVRYLAPTPIDAEVELRARVVEARDRVTRLRCTVLAAGEPRAEADVTAVRVPPAWRDAPAP